MSKNSAAKKLALLEQAKELCSGRLTVLKKNDAVKILELLGFKESHRDKNHGNSAYDYTGTGPSLKVTIPKRSMIGALDLNRMRDVIVELVRLKPNLFTEIELKLTTPQLPPEEWHDEVHREGEYHHL